MLEASLQILQMYATILVMNKNSYPHPYLRNLTRIAAAVTSVAVFTACELPGQDEKTDQKIASSANSLWKPQEMTPDDKQALGKFCGAVAAGKFQTVANKIVSVTTRPKPLPNKNFKDAQRIFQEYDKGKRPTVEIYGKYPEQKTGALIEVLTKLPSKKTNSKAPQPPNSARLTYLAGLEGQGPIEALYSSLSMPLDEEGKIVGFTATKTDKIGKFVDVILQNNSYEITTYSSNLSREGLEIENLKFPASACEEPQSQSTIEGYATLMTGYDISTVSSAGHILSEGEKTMKVAPAILEIVRQYT